MHGGVVIGYALIAFPASIGIGFVLPEFGAALLETLGDAASGVERGVAAG